MKPRAGNGAIMPSASMASSKGLQEFRKRLRKGEVRSYDMIRDTPEQISLEAARCAISGRTYSLKGMEFSVDEPVDWSAAGKSRSYRMYLQSWNFLEPFFVHYSKRGDEESFEILRVHVDDWIDHFGKAVEIGKDIAVFADNLEGEGLFVGHPMAIAGRFYRLSYFIDVMARREDVPDERIFHYLQVLSWHSAFLSLDRYFPEKHNHGLQVALSQIIGAGRLLQAAGRQSLAVHGRILEELYAQGKRRLFRILAEHVCEDGTHKEHSPHYHMVVANAIRQPVVSGVMGDRIVRDVLKAMTDMGSYLFDFRGRVVNIGDGDLDLLAGGAEHFKWKEWPAQPEARAFAEGGYWFVRGTTEAGKFYLALQAAMHSRTHKHADTCTFVWQDRDRDILIDAGRFGYVGRTEVGSELFNDGFWYSDPRRVYVESTRAHNTVSVDGRNHPRFRVRPFGSSIRAWTEKDGLFACEAAVPNLPGVRHFRLLLVRPGQWLLCVDTFRASGGREHDYRQHFQIHPDWREAARSARSVLFTTDDGARLHVTSIFGDTAVEAVERGKGDVENDAAEELAGWWSRRHMVLEPCNSLSLLARGNHVTMATLFSFDEAEIDEDFTTFNVTRRRLRFRWRQGGKTHKVVIDRGEDEDGKSRLTLS